MFKKGGAYVLAQFLLIALVLWGPRAYFWDWAFSLSLALFMALVGAWLFILSFLYLKKNLTPLPFPKKDAFLVRGGPYRYIRHPMYLSVLVFAWAWTFYTQNLLTFFYSVLLFILLDLKARKEEKWLEEKFMDYADYKSKSKRLIPFIY